jgi:hypothetical protein
MDHRLICHRPKYHWNISDRLKSHRQKYRRSNEITPDEGANPTSSLSKYLAVEGSSRAGARSTNSRPPPNPSRRTSCRTKARRPPVAAHPVFGRRWLAASLERKKSPTWLEVRSSSSDLARLERRRGRRKMRRWRRTVLQCRSQVSCPPSAQWVKLKEGTVSRDFFASGFRKIIRNGPLW